MTILYFFQFFDFRTTFLQQTFKNQKKGALIYNQTDKFKVTFTPNKNQSGVSEKTQLITIWNDKRLHFGSHCGEDSVQSLSEEKECIRARGQLIGYRKNRKHTNPEALPINISIFFVFIDSVSLSLFLFLQLFADHNTCGKLKTRL